MLFPMLGGASLRLLSISWIDLIRNHDNSAPACPARYSGYTDHVVFGRSLEDRLQRLAKRLDHGAQLDQARMEREQRIEALRKRAGEELHQICREFVVHLNGFLTLQAAELTPALFPVQGFGAGPAHLVQINVNGRILQFTYQPTGELELSDEIRVPYTLEGTVRWFNQAMLDRDEVRDHRLFYCIDGKTTGWRYLDHTSRKLSAVNHEYLVSLLEQLVES